MQVILLSGKQGSGKTTTAEALEARFRSSGLGLIRHRFSAPVYTAHDAVYAVLRPLGILDDTKKDGLLLQVLGTWGRKKDPEIWVKAAKAHLAQIERQFSGSPVHLVGLIEDARFRNEFDGFSDAIKVRLECPEVVRESRTVSWRENTQHPSETELDDYASAGKFDLTFQTDTQSVSDITEVVLAVYRERAANGTGSNP